MGELVFLAECDDTCGLPMRPRRGLMSHGNNRRRNARFWGGVGVTLIMLQVIVFLYLPVHFFEERSERVADFLIVFMMPLGGFAARLLYAAVPSAGWEVTRDRWRTMAMLALLVFVVTFSTTGTGLSLVSSSRSASNPTARNVPPTA